MARLGGASIATAVWNLSLPLEDRPPSSVSISFIHLLVSEKLTQSCLTLCDPMDCSLPGSSIHGDSSGKDTGVGCPALLQGIFPIQGSNPGLPHCRRILYTHPTHPPEPLGKPCYNMLDLVYMASIFVTFS